MSWAMATSLGTADMTVCVAGESGCLERHGSAVDPQQAVQQQGIHTEDVFDGFDALQGAYQSGRRSKDTDGFGRPVRSGREYAFETGRRRWLEGRHHSGEPFDPPEDERDLKRKGRLVECFAGAPVVPSAPLIWPFHLQFQSLPYPG